MTTERASRPGHLMLIRFSGDISTKAARTKQRFVRCLEGNLAEGLDAAGIRHRTRRDWSRLYVEADSPLALDVLSRVFGVQSVSPVERRAWERLEDVVAAGEEIFREEVRGRRFAVRARRGGDAKTIAFRSADVERALGTALLPHAAGVDLGNPEVTAALEIHPGTAYFFTRVVPGPGGLPLGTQGAALSLVSGGFDSAVASWRMLRRGVALEYLFFNLGGNEHRAGLLPVMRVLAELWSHGRRPLLHEIDFQPMARAIQEQVHPRYWQVVLKRVMLRAADRVAAERDLPALVTGEAVGQVSSQTLANIAVISRATALPILRPLVGANKEEIIETARTIGTYEPSAAVPEYCALEGRHPHTGATAGAVEAEEEKLDPALLERVVAERATHDLRALDAAANGNTVLEADAIPADAVLLDLRSVTAYRAWHPPEALFLEYTRALETYRALPRDRTYVLYCEVGFKSAHLAERMQADGFRAFHLRRGLRALAARSPEADLAFP